MPSNKKRFGPQRGIGTSGVGRGGDSGHLRTLRIPGGGQARGALGIPRVRPRKLSARSMIGRAGMPLSIVPRTQFVTFDRSIIRTNWNRINRVPLQRAANLIRIIARGSIKRRKKGGKPSAPGTPPHSRWGSGTKGSKRSITPPFKMIYNVPIRFGTGQMIGMVGFNSNPVGELPPPGLHELGGHARRRVLNPHREQTLPRDSRGRFTRRRTPWRIPRSVRYPKRPFMVPAVLKARTRLPSFWRDSVRRGGATGTALPGLSPRI